MQLHARLHRKRLSIAERYTSRSVSIGRISVHLLRPSQNSLSTPKVCTRVLTVQVIRLLTP